MATCSQCGKDVSLFERDIVTGACCQCRSAARNAWLWNAHPDRDRGGAIHRAPDRDRPQTGLK